MRPKALSIWAFVAVSAVFVEAIVRLGARAVQTVAAGLDAAGWAALAASVGLLAYFEGYRGLQRRFAPTLVARALAAGALRPGPRSVLVAPLFALSLAGTTGRARARAWGAVALIVVAIALVRCLPDPWRGVVDAGVAAALTWGLSAMLVQFVRVTRAPAAPSARAYPLGRGDLPPQRSV